MDLRMPRMDGWNQGDGRLRERHPDGRVIALTTYADDESVLGALRAGARGYLTKDASSQDIHSAILTVAAGDAALDPAVQSHVVAALAEDAGRVREPSPPVRPELPDDLTPREAQVLALIAEGSSNAEIAERLVVSPTTIKSHINHLFAKRPARPGPGGQLRLPDGDRDPPALTSDVVLDGRRLRVGGRTAIDDDLLTEREACFERALDRTRVHDTAESLGLVVGQARGHAHDQLQATRSRLGVVDDIDPQLTQLETPRVCVGHDHRRDTRGEHRGQELVRRGTGVGTTESRRLVGDDRVTPVDINLVTKRAVNRPRCGCHAHVLILGSCDDAVIRTNPQQERYECAEVDQSESLTAPVWGRPPFCSPQLEWSC